MTNPLMFAVMGMGIGMLSIIILEKHVLCGGIMGLLGAVLALSSAITIIVQTIIGEGGIYPIIPIALELPFAAITTGLIAGIVVAFAGYKAFIDDAEIKNVTP